MWLETRNILDIRPVYKKQSEMFDRTLKCITHLIFLLLATATTPDSRLKVISDHIQETGCFSDQAEADYRRFRFTKLYHVLPHNDFFKWKYVTGFFLVPDGTG